MTESRKAPRPDRPTCDHTRTRKVERLGTLQDAKDDHAMTLARMPEHLRQEAITWARTRPPVVQALMERFPPSSPLLLNRVPHGVVGYSEDGGLWLAPFARNGTIPPRNRAKKVWICKDHLPT